MPSAAAQDAATELQQLVQAIQDTQIANICAVAATAWLSYDIILTLPQEVSLIWRAKWTIPKSLYFLVRYYTLFSLLFTVVVNTSHNLSLARWLWYNGFNGTLLSAVFGEAMFLMRLYAAYERSKTILFTIIFLFLAEFATGVVTASLVVSSIRIVPRPPDYPLPGCLLTPPKHVNLSLMVWAVAMGVTCVYFLLILYKFAHNLSLRKGSGMSNGMPIWELQKRSPVVFLFLRDSAFYFFLVFLGNTLNLVFEIIFAGRAIIPMGTVWLMVIYALSASRLCLNTRSSLQRAGRYYQSSWLGLGDEVELQDRSGSSGRPSNLFDSMRDKYASAIPQSTLVFEQSDGKASLHRGAFELDRVEGFSSSGGYVPPTTPVYVRSAECELDPWVVVAQPRLGVGVAF